MKITHKNIFFHHTGIVTKDIESSKYFFVNLGYKASKTFEDASQGSEILVLKKARSPTIELISPMNEQSPSYGWLKRIGGGKKVYLQKPSTSGVVIRTPLLF